VTARPSSARLAPSTTAVPPPCLACRRVGRPFRRRGLCATCYAIPAICDRYPPVHPCTGDLVAGRDFNGRAKANRRKLPLPAGGVRRKHELRRRAAALERLFSPADWTPMGTTGRDGPRVLSLGDWIGGDPMRESVDVDDAWLDDGGGSGD
jgi:hypothetical protein